MDETDKRIDEMETKMLNELKDCFSRIRHIKNNYTNVDNLLDELENEFGIKLSSKKRENKYSKNELVKSIYLDIYRETGEDFVPIEDIIERAQVEGADREDILELIDDLRLQDYLIQLNDTIKYKHI
ncbi:hypothetical protein Metev_0999 [Methanohalobium evestigatum Z-7303]|uniref:Uncharacterized protein n=1 Tax=Methanohalobium evestigatum (strain ATCC BAA-1072 / DSM 3721 / NBRC 107634 / OCM 161 / Z-7303) TaxID=644295 RepID=D7E7D9_METEZ|nr:hypothetical protein [Methanohalobium evestigatum]ADI73888.1 hypothetical protein Metev_0999 [Methanohalobium evestigatum Z-7303]